MFTDIVGSTEMTARLGDPVDRIGPSARFHCAEMPESTGRAEVKHTGDGPSTGAGFSSLAAR